MRTLLALGLMAASAATAQANSFDIASGLGTVLAAEEECGLSYDQAAIAAFIEARVPADDLEFPSLLSTMTAGAEYSLKNMTASAKTAHCAQIRRIAKSYSFVQ